VVVHEEQIAPPATGRPLHATALLAALERAAAAAGGWESVRLLAAGCGPGSFTGLRIGLATGRALAGALALEATGVCTLDVLALGMAEGAGGGLRLAVVDARRGEVFAALYDVEAERLWDPFVATPGQLAERLAGRSEPVMGAGSGALRFREELEREGVRILPGTDPVHRVAARHVCALAEAGKKTKLEPIYLRPPDAERWRDRDSTRTAES
jgi:tRNA threonylcarbamoyl adenosine modification protein YeaZ